MAPLDPEQAADLLRRLKSEAPPTSPTWLTATSEYFTSWKHRVRSVLANSLGETHRVTHAFDQVPWTPSVTRPGSVDSAYRTAFAGALNQARGLIDAAIFELEQLPQSATPIPHAGYDPELWEHVSAHIAAKEWAKVASQASIFTEHRIRTWTGHPDAEVGRDLMVRVFGPNGDFRLGHTDPEKEGWQLFAMGIFMACRNVDVHRPQKRPDLEQYAMGVLGANSLLLTQLRHEHGNRFQDTSPVATEPV
jgi:hypothetical protein